MDVIKRDILRNGLYKNLLVDFDECDRPVYLGDDGSKLSGLGKTAESNIAEWVNASTVVPGFIATANSVPPASTEACSQVRKKYGNAGAKRSAS